MCGRVCGDFEQKLVMKQSIFQPSTSTDTSTKRPRQPLLDMQQAVQNIEDSDDEGYELLDCYADSDLESVSDNESSGEDDSKTTGIQSIGLPRSTTVVTGNWSLKSVIMCTECKVYLCVKRGGTYWHNYHFKKGYRR